MRSWSVTVLSEQSVLKKYTQDPSPAVLHKFLTNTYPDAEYHSVYEAGFCGFWIHWELTDLGIHNIVVNPADVPTMAGERLRKTDAVDSGKLARSLRSGELKGIYVPDSAAAEIRSLIRLRDSLCILTILTPILMMLTPSKRAGLSKSSLCLLANRQRRSRKDITFSFS